MFGLHIHKWVSVESLQMTNKRYGAVVKIYNLYIQRCEVCGRLRTQKVKL